jgi:eukaryotic-like serine/threonine-protein kinase
VWSIPIAGGAAKQLLPLENSFAEAISPDGKLASYFLASQLKYHLEVADFASRHVIFQGSMDESDFGESTLRFSPDSRALVYNVHRNEGDTLLNQPLDGTAPHALLTPLPEKIDDYGWSPSGKQLAVTRVKSSSDVVMITDQAGKH